MAKLFDQKAFCTLFSTGEHKMKSKQSDTQRPNTIFETIFFQKEKKFFWQFLQ
jgi:hypothetical protein